MTEREIKSKINPKFSFSNTVWVVSVLNTDGKWFGLPGHSVIVVEGIGLESINQKRKNDSGSKIEDEQLKYNADIEDSFVRMCDIQSKLFKDEKARLLNNVKGYMSEIRIYDSHRASYNIPSKSHYVDPKNTVTMLEAILEDKRKVEKFLKVEGEPLLFQRWGKEGFFTNSKDGDSCAGWCIEKLAIVGVDDGVKPKPKLMTCSCCTLV